MPPPSPSSPSPNPSAPDRQDASLTAARDQDTSRDAGPNGTSLTPSFLAPPEQPDEIGRLGPYRVLKLLGEGGMGVVFQAEDPQLQRPVALKAMLPSIAGSDSAKKRFLREARAAAALK